MAENNVLIEVKKRLGITGDYQDGTLSGYISDVEEFLRDAGVPEYVLNSTAALGVISRGVSDLWNYGAGNAEFSPYFLQRATQLSYRPKEG